MSFRRWLAQILCPTVEPFGQPIELRRGGLYVIESVVELNADALAGIQGYLDGFGKKTGCEFLILDAGLHVAIARRQSE